MTCEGARPEDLAREIGMSAKALRGWLRREFPRTPAEHRQPWSLTHEQVIAARTRFDGERPPPLGRGGVTRVAKGGHRRDQAYVTDLLARLLGEEALREHRFPWLQGDTGHLLPVDAYFPGHKVVLEYRERQHLVDRPDSFPMWDRRMTVSGVTRREQRSRYDAVREAEIPVHSLKLIVVNADDLAVDRRGRLLQNERTDAASLRRVLLNVGIELPPQAKDR